MVTCIRAQEYPRFDRFYQFLKAGLYKIREQLIGNSSATHQQLIGSRHHLTTLQREQFYNACKYVEESRFGNAASPEVLIISRSQSSLVSSRLRQDCEHEAQDCEHKMQDYEQTRAHNLISSAHNLMSHVIILMFSSQWLTNFYYST